MKKLFFLLFLLCLSTINVWAQFEVKLYPTNQPDTLFVLPGEFWAIQHGIQSVNNYDFYAIEAYTDLWQYREKSLPGSFYFHMNGQYAFEKDTSGTFSYGVYDQDGTYWAKLRWLPNYSSAAQAWLYLWVIEGCSGLEVGESARAYVFGMAGDSAGTRSSDAKYQYLIGIDGICGDINQDGTVNEDDVTIGLNGLDNMSMLDWYGRFTNTGINYGLGRVFFSQPDITSLAMINIWIHDHNDPAVKDLGIGELMSVRSKKITPASYKKTLTDNNLNVVTQAFAVMVTTVLPNGEIWSQSAPVKDGQINFNIPDPGLEYRVEAISLPASITDIDRELEIPTEFNLGQNYPNPFNPSTIISFSLPQSGNALLKVYNLLGQVVAILVDEELTAGYHNINFDASRLAAGVYIYTLEAGQFHTTKKMILIK